MTRTSRERSHAVVLRQAKLERGFLAFLYHRELLFGMQLLANLYFRLLENIGKQVRDTDLSTARLGSRQETTG